MLQSIRIELARLRAAWALARLTPLAREAVLKSAPETWRKIDAILDARREHARPPRGG